MSLEETHDWAKQVSKDFKAMAQRAEDVNALNKELEGGGDHQLATVQFVKVSALAFEGEVGKVDDDLFFHFFPAESEEYSDISEETVMGDDGRPVVRQFWVFKEGFEESLGDAFLEVFKLEDKLCWDFVSELNSWVVRCTGFGANIMANQLAEKLFNNLQKRLEQ